MTVPILSSYQTLENSQGTLDPLGLYTISDRLATRLAPGLRERMKHPRYLTAIAVSTVVCSSFDEEELAKDEISAPWQVFEWYVVSALVKRFHEADPKQLLGMSGREKTTRAMREHVPLNASRYLKTPSVFGFHGVYRTLARNMNLTVENQPDEFGMQLVDVWEKEQGLVGFQNRMNNTSGLLFRQKLYDAVGKGLELAEVAKPWTWEPYNLLAESLAPKCPGKMEAQLLLNELKNGHGGVRADLLDAVASSEGLEILSDESEKGFHQWLLGRSTQNKDLLKTIMAYERFCRLLFNAFYEILLWLRNHQSKGNLHGMSALPHVKKASEELPGAFLNAENLLMPFIEEYIMFQANQVFSQKLSAKEWIRLLMEHHVTVQKNKPPSGKAPWLLEHGSDSYLLNTTQYLDVELNEEYVHQYRTFSLYSFLKDLGKIAS